ncbi:MAG: J domain-containing protein, partial [Thermodesulfovibrionales bacterium]
MDRFSEPRATEKQLSYQRALEFIGEVRAGISWERFCLHAVRSFDAFIDFLNDTDEVKEFLSLNRIDRRYVIENVKKILERLHFNPENDHYLSLGLHQSASETQIHNRWKNLMFLYHPDRTQDSGEDTNRAARKINEVYSTLKDPVKKLEYDRTMLRRTAGPVGGQGDPRRMSALRNVRRRERHDLLSPAMRRILPKMILPVSIAISSLILLIIFWGNKPPVDLRPPAASNGQVTEVMKKTTDEQADSGGRKQTVDQVTDGSDKTLKGKAEEQDRAGAEKSVNKRTIETIAPKTSGNLLTGPGDLRSFQKSGASDEKLNKRKDQTADNGETLLAQRTAIEKRDESSGEQQLLK